MMKPQAFLALLFLPALLAATRERVRRDLGRRSELPADTTRNVSARLDNGLECDHASASRIVRGHS